MTATPLELDHVFVMTRPDAPEAAPLFAAGLVAGRRREHPGQGTANACVFFRRVMLELLWIADDAAARSDLAAPLRLPERARWRDTGAAPFGICLRAPRDAADALPFGTLAYRPPYLPPGMTIRVAADLPATAPIVFAIAAPRQPLDVAHPLRDRDVERCRVRGPGAERAAAVLGAAAPPDLAFAAGDAHLLEFELARDPGAPAATGAVDLRPQLPLVVRW